jgi:hypothetical protein
MQALAPLGCKYNMEDGEAAGINDGKNTDFWIVLEDTIVLRTSPSRAKVRRKRKPSTRRR